MSVTISLCMIVKNEEKMLSGCLDCVCGIVDEINIVDTGSTDGTVELARRYTDRIFHFDWIDDFAAARNFSFSKATKEYILWLDADDVLTTENQEKLRNLKRNLKPDVDYVIMQYHYSHDDAGNPKSVHARERLVRRAAGFVWKGAVHETIQYSGRVTAVDIFVTHRGAHDDDSIERNMKILEREIADGNADLTTYYYYGRTLYKYGRIDEAAAALEKFLSFEERKNYDLPDAYILLHNSYLRMKKFDLAERALTDNEALLSDKAEYYCALGLHLAEDLNDYAAAIPYYERALKCEGKHPAAGLRGHADPDYYYYMPHYLMGRAQMELGQFERAAESFKNAVKYKNDPELPPLIEKLDKIVRLQKLI